MTDDKQVKPALIQFIVGERTKQQQADYEQAMLNDQKVITIDVTDRQKVKSS